MNAKIAIGTALAGAFALGALVIAYSSGQEQAAQSKAPPKQVSTSFSDLEEEEIRRIVYDYLMEHPEVIIEAVNAFSERERARAEAQARDVAAERLSDLFNPDHGFVAGKNPDNAKVAVIELYDYHCGFCKRAAPMVKDIVESDADVKVVFRELPILREESDYAAEMSLASREQGEFLDYHFAMLSASGVLTKDRVHAFAKQEGLNVAQLEKARQRKEIPKAIMETHEIAAAMGVEGTPTFIIASLDGSYIDIVEGFRPEELNEKIAAAKRAAR